MKTLAALSALVLLGLGCSSSSKSSSGSSNRPPTVAQLTQDVEDATAALSSSINSLQAVAEGRGDLAKARDAYVASLDALETRVQKVRDAGMQLAQRRDEFLKAWLEKSEGIQSETLKASAEKRRTELMSEFMTLGGKASELRRVFAPVHGSLKDCGRFLESDATAGAAKMLAPEYENIRKMEPEVLKAASDYTAQLKKIGEQLSASR